MFTFHPLTFAMTSNYQEKLRETVSYKKKKKLARAFIE